VLRGERGRDVGDAASRLGINIFADGADLDAVASQRTDPRICGFTTNPALMRAAGVTDYEGFARRLVELVPSLPVSLEVLTDDFAEMRDEAATIASWGQNVYVKVPVINARGESSVDLIHDLSASGIKVNVTAVMTVRQALAAVAELEGGATSFISVFAGRIADTGVDPIPVVSEVCDLVHGVAGTNVIWASARELLNVVQADAVGCDAITLTSQLILKLDDLGRDLDEMSLETVQTFSRDAAAAGLRVAGTTKERATAASV
jgi:transaldolase